jgi:DNA-binding CsgD family transcriptional regulator
MGKTNSPIGLTPAQRRVLLRLVARPTASYGHARRARVILLGADGVPGVEIARRLGLKEPAVARIRRRFSVGGVPGLEDQPKAGRGNNVPKDMIQKIIAKALSRPPAGYSHWSTPQLAGEFGLGKTVIHKILRANDVKPHLTRTFKVRARRGTSRSISARKDRHDREGVIYVWSGRRETGSQEVAAAKAVDG